MNKIPVIQPYFTRDEYEAVEKVLDSGWVAQGPRVREFERVIAEHEGVAEGVAVTSCTTALALAMSVSGMGAGMDVFVPAFTFVATANAVVMTGAHPVLIDVDKQNYNIKVSSISDTIETWYEERADGLFHKTSGRRLFGIVPVHQFGLCADMQRIGEIARRYQLHIIEDAACALGSKIGETHIGGFGNMSCVSFHPRKSITTGEGGMILTNDSSAARKMRELRSHGSSLSADVREAEKGYLLPAFDEAGYNYRMTDIQAAVGLAQAKKLDFILEERRKLAHRYDTQIIAMVPELIPPFVPQGYYHTYQSYVCMIDDKALSLASVEEAGVFRNYLLETLETRGIATRQGTHAVHMLGYYQKTDGYQKEDFPGAYVCDRMSLTLPLSVQMIEEEQDYVVEQIADIIKEWRERCAH